MKIDSGKWDLWAEQVLDKVKKAGASDAEISLSLDIARDVSVRNGELEKAETAEARHVSLRAYDGKRTASTSFSLDADADLSQRISDLIAATKASPEDPFCGLNTPSQIAPSQNRDFEQFDDAPLLSIDDLRRRADDLSKSVGKDLVVDHSGTSHAHRRQVYMATNGLKRDDYMSSASQGIVTIHEGVQLVRDYAADTKVFLADLEPLEETAKRAQERTWNAKNPIRPPSGKFPVIFDERVSSSLIGHLLGAMSGSSIARRTSWLIDYDEPVLPMDWVLRETPFRLRKLSSSERDAEGFAKSEMELIANGRPQTWITNLSHARQLEIESSGHATGSGTGRGAGVAMARLDAPMVSREALFKTMNEGLLVTGFIGATINPHTGDYSRGVNGFWVRGGEIAEAVNEATIASNLKIMLPSLQMADDADSDQGMVVGSLLCQEMTIAGA